MHCYSEIDFTEDIDVPTISPVNDTIPPLIEESIGPCPDDDLFKLHLQEKKKVLFIYLLIILYIIHYFN